jgi:hypothetical protein
MMPVVDARRGQVFYGLYEKPAGGGSRHHAWVRRGAYGVCDRGSLALVLQAHGARDTVILAERQGLLDEVPSGARVIEADVYAEHLVIGQDALEEPGVMPLGKSLGPWLRVGLARSIFERGAATAVGESTEGLGVGAVGSPESVTPIYVRSPDADLHIQKMKDPWADDNAT